MAEHVVGTPDEFPEGRGRAVEVDGIPIAVFNVAGEFYAVSGVCPHKGAPLALAGRAKRPAARFAAGEGVRGRIDEAPPAIACPWHDLTFDLETGDCPATRHRLRTFEVRATEQVTIVL